METVYNAIFYLKNARQLSVDPETGEENMDNITTPPHTHTTSGLDQQKELRNTA